MIDEDHLSTSETGGLDPETTVAVATRPDEEPARRQAYVVVLAGTCMGTMMPVKDGMTIGRASGATLQTLDEGVSRLHVRLSETPEGELSIEDLASRNGTFVNGERVTTAALKDGDKIRIGNATIFKISHGDALDESFQRQMYDAAVRDGLTQVYNRRCFEERLRSEFCFAQRHQTLLSLIILDLDHFKQINDAHGHPTGDAVLVGLVALVQRAIREEDLLARIGGEEFALLCRGIDANGALVLAERVREAVERATLVASPPIRVTVSAGVASVPDPTITAAAEFVAAADGALYRAKRAGRNRTCRYEAPGP
jgi:diguanylate cyclase (GGDEF)-like protein